MIAFDALESYRRDELVPESHPVLVFDAAEPWRGKRLDRVVGFLAAYVIDVFALLSIEDHKGELVVTSRRILTTREQAVLFTAWGSVIGDGADENVTFRVAA